MSTELGNRPSPQSRATLPVPSDSRRPVRRNNSYLKHPPAKLLGICCEDKGLIGHQAVHTPELVAITPRDKAPGRPPAPVEGPPSCGWRAAPGEGKQRLGLPCGGEERSCCLHRPQVCTDVVAVPHGHPKEMGLGHSLPCRCRYSEKRFSC